MTESGPIDQRRLLVRRSASQLLDRRIAGGPDAAVRALLAVQAQDRSAWRLALRARVDAITADDVNRALSDTRSLLVAWLNRGTLHLVCSDDYPWLLALTAPTHLVASARRLAQEGLTPDDVECGVACIERSLATEGPLLRAQLRERLADRGIRTEGQATVHLLFAAVGGGLFRAFATVDGTAAATWAIRRSGARAAIRIDPFEALGSDDVAALRAEAEDVARFEGRMLAGVDGLVMPA
jgi:hypothetical protein